MSDEATFLAQLREHPNDTGTRLVFADYLDEHDGPQRAAHQRVLGEPDSDARRLQFADACDRAGDAQRAEFVRVQCELAKARATSVAYRHWTSQVREQGLPSLAAIIPRVMLAGGDEQTRQLLMTELRRFADLESREQKLFHAHGYSWCDGLLGSEWKTGGHAKAEDQTVAYVRYHLRERATNDIGISFSRGFVGAIECTAGDWIEHGRAVMGVQPVQRVSWTSVALLAWETERVPPYATRVRLDHSGARALMEVSERQRMLHRNPVAFADEVTLKLARHEWPGVTIDWPRSVPL